MGLIGGLSFVAVRVMELDCRYSFTSELEGSVEGPAEVLEAEVELVDGINAVSGSGASSLASPRFFFFWGVRYSEVPSRILRFFLRPGSSAKMSLAQSDDPARKGAQMGSGGVCSTVESPMVAASGFVLSFFFFFLGITRATMTCI